MGTYDRAQLGFWTGGSSRTMARAPTLGYGHANWHVKQSRSEAGRETATISGHRAKNVHKCSKCGFETDKYAELRDHEKVHAAASNNMRIKVAKQTLANRVYEGKLWKRGGIRKNWKRRYFKLGTNARAGDGSFLFAYYVDQASSRTRRPIGVVDLRGAVCRPTARRVHRNKEMNDPLKFFFEIQVPGRIFEFACPNATEGRNWMKTIKLAIDSAPEGYQKISDHRWSARGSAPQPVVCKVPGCRIAWHNHQGM